MNNIEQRLNKLEEKMDLMTKGNLQMCDYLSDSHEVNGEKYQNLYDLVQSLETRMQILVELLSQGEVINQQEFNKYQAVICRMARKKRLERTLAKEVDE